jgi:c-di-GMP-binding flagellar brake protein YcgR
MKFSKLQVGTRLELEVYDDAGQTTGVSLISELEWVEDEDRAIIATPIRAGTVYPICTDTLIGAYFMDKDGLHTFRARVLARAFRARVLARETGDNIPLLRIALINEIKRIQRRQYYRLSCMLPIEFRLIESDNGREHEFKHALVKNISGGGACIVSNDKMELGQLIECELQLTTKNRIKFLGKIVRVSVNEQKGKYKHNIGIQFEKIETKSREAIISYTLEEQRKLLKMGTVNEKR